jgi:hypothetical protein
MAVTLGKDITISGVSNARSFTVTGTATEVDVTKFGDTSKKFKKPFADITVEVECVDAPGVAAGGTFTLGGTSLGSHTFICTGVSEESPIDGITTFTVSGSRTEASS